MPLSSEGPSPDLEVHKNCLMTRICPTKLHKLARASLARQNDVGKSAAAEEAGRVGCTLQQWPQQAVVNGHEPRQGRSMHPSQLSRLPGMPMQLA